MNKSMCSPPPCRADERSHAQIPLGPWLRRLLVAIPIARLGADPEGAHQLRRALAHLQAWLALADRRALREEVRWLRTRASKVRDLDVRLTQDPPPAVARRWQRRRVGAHQRLLDALDDPRTAALLATLATLPPLAREGTRDAVARLAARTLERGARAMRKPTIKRLHALRRSVRRLRYALEWTGRPTGQMARLQDTLGRLCDHAFTLRVVQTKCRRVRDWKQEMEHELRREARRARGLWKKVRSTLEDRA